MQLGEAEARDEPDKTRTPGSRAVRARSSSPSSAGRASSSWAHSPPPRLLKKSSYRSANKSCFHSKGILLSALAQVGNLLSVKEE